MRRHYSGHVRRASTNRQPFREVDRGNELHVFDVARNTKLSPSPDEREQRIVSVALQSAMIYRAARGDERDMVEVGALLAGKYRIDRVLGQGGMGLVVAATHVHLAQRVALKFLLPEFLHDPAIVERFLREARASAALRGEYLCRVSDVGTLDNGSPYIVMELLDGRDLAKVLAENGPLPIETASHHVLQACVALAEAHALGIVHRDLKPANLFLAGRPDGTQLVKVLDFGIAKAQHDTSFNLTRTASVMGSPGYMSPEQLRSSRDADVRSDIWALGVILYELVSGRPPYVAESITELALRVAMDPLPPLAIAAPTGFDRVVMRCLEKDPARRFQNVAALAQALVPFGGHRARELAAGAARILNVVAASTSSHDIAVSNAPTTLSSSAGSATRVRQRFPWAVLVGAVAVTIAAIIAVFELRSGGDEAT
ncbi:MAG TPA: serine/threonine-protein kinase, partial [Kofleriaceae bacterium]